jgi:hypothetical protein
MKSDSRRRSPIDRHRAFVRRGVFPGSSGLPGSLVFAMVYAKRKLGLASGFRPRSGFSCGIGFGLSGFKYTEQCWLTSPSAHARSPTVQWSDKIELAALMRTPSRISTDRRAGQSRWGRFCAVLLLGFLPSQFFSIECAAHEGCEFEPSEIPPMLLAASASGRTSCPLP